MVGQLNAGYPHNRLLLSRRGASFSTRVKKALYRHTRWYSMTRKHFRKIASILRERKADPMLIRDIASMCASENMYFDYDRFYTAAGLEE